MLINEPVPRSVSPDPYTQNWTEFWPDLAGAHQLNEPIHNIYTQYSGSAKKYCLNSFLKIDKKTRYF